MHPNPISKQRYCSESVRPLTQRIKKNVMQDINPIITTTINCSGTNLSPQVNWCKENEREKAVFAIKQLL